jgi:CBS domain-containing protein
VSATALRTEMRPAPGRPLVADAMLRGPTVHDAAESVESLRRLFLDDHVLMALLVEDGRLVAAVERRDLARPCALGAPARALGALRGRTVRPEAPLEEALEAMRRGARRRLAVVDARGTLRGLLCLKASGEGFCSDEGVRERRRERTRRRRA